MQHSPTPYKNTQSFQDSGKEFFTVSGWLPSLVLGQKTDSVLLGSSAVLLIAIRVLDDVVLGTERFFSFSDRGLL